MPPLLPPRVAILLSTYNGEPYLRAQLDSLIAQTFTRWTLYWRDDGSTDNTLAIMQDFTREAGQGRCIQLAGEPGRLKPAASFFSLLREVQPCLEAGDLVAFADQDDVWLNKKLARGVAALAGVPSDAPALYAARQILVDDKLRRIGVSRRLTRPIGFPNSLAQNVTTGCTVLLNRCAASLVARSQPAPATLHDWWCYLMVTAAGGRLLNDDEPVVFYRQHDRNVVGAPRSASRRAIAALQRGPSVFMGMMRQHVAALCAQPDLITEDARAQLHIIDRALKDGFPQRFAALKMPGLRRQTAIETWLFRLWFLIG